MTHTKVIDVLDYATALKFVKKAVDTAPTRVYERDEKNGCAYVHTTAGGDGGDYVYTPGCLVGHALIDMGVPMETFIDCDINISVSSSEVLKRLEELGYIGKVTNKAIDFMRRVQWKQDDRLPWSDALRHGVEFVEDGMYNGTSE